jgi:2-dehydro-3-deoxyglucarate aldolase
MNPDFKKKLKDKQKLIGTLISLPSPELAEVAAGAGFDWLFLDMEHGLLDAGAVRRIVQAVGDRCPCLVRLPANEEVWITKALDSGIAGLIFPHLNTAEEAAAAVSRSRYAPQGTRGVGLSRAQGYGARLDEDLASANAGTSLIAQVEHIDAVRNIDWILEVPGVDAAFVGPYDLSASLGKPGRVSEPDVRQAIGLVRDACAKHKLPAGIFAGTAEAAAEAFKDGFSLVCAAADVSLFSRAAADLVKGLR